VIDHRLSGEQQNNSERIVVLGRIGGAFGVAGWVKIQSFTDPPANLLKYPVWLLRQATSHAGTAGARNGWKERRCLQGREVSQGLQARIEGVETREQAADLSGTEIGVRRSEMPALKAGEYYWDDLIGLDAVTPDGATLGRVAEIRAMPAHPLLRIIGKSSRLQDEILVPLVRERIKAVDLPAGRVTVDWQTDWMHGE
jgi:16S rRNA processing protein RimM